QLLAFSRKQILQPRVVNLNDVIAGLQTLLARLVGEDVTLDVRGQQDLWPVRADPGQMEQVLMNRAANARDAMPEGGRLSISTANVEVQPDPLHRPGLQAGVYVTMTVADNGSGGPDDVREHMFEPFFTTKDQGKGTGLGLATVYGIIKQSDGSVYVESETGAGTRFIIYLPRVPAMRTANEPRTTQQNPVEPSRTLFLFKTGGDSDVVGRDRRLNFLQFVLGGEDGGAVPRGAILLLCLSFLVLV